jgi:A/G-specific adenine glycosylase
MERISEALLAWYDQNKRIMPWRDIRNPYATWVSETMLQQTQVTTVIPYYNRFMSLFPTVLVLAHANLESVLKAWEGLGYYSRARNLKRGAEQVADRFDGIIPSDIQQLLSIQGIGPYTAGAILSIAFNMPYPAIDGNVIRVLSRIDGIRQAVTTHLVQHVIRTRASHLCTHERPGDFNQGLMDLGATICVPRQPRCYLCPLINECDAFKTGDAHNLPLKTQKPQPLTVPVGVALVTRNNRILVTKRTERMLGGLYVFLLNDTSDEMGILYQTLKDMDIQCRYEGDLGKVRHIFTHRIWNMRIYHYVAFSDAVPDGVTWVTKSEMCALPFPSAMKTAYSHALKLLT